MRAAVSVAMVAARDQGLDPEWPPVLIALVLLMLGAAVVSVCVVYRALRAERRGAPGWGRRGPGSR